MVGAVEVRVDRVGAPAVTPARAIPAPAELRRRLAPEIPLLTAVSLAAYLVLAWWLRMRLHYFIGDALARSANALFVTSSRDPHLGAIGFYWPPLPSLVQLPLVALLAPLRAAAWAGPLVSASAMAATVATLAKVAEALGGARWVRFAVAAAFATNPMVAFFAANGMGEALFFLTTSIALLGFLRWVRQGRSVDLALLALGLAAAVMVRYEALAFVVLFALAAAARPHRPSLSARIAAAVAVPAAFVFTVWMGAQQLLLRDALFFLHANNGQDGAGASWLPSPHGNPLVAGWWAGRWTLVMAPVLVLVPVVAWLRMRELAWPHLIHEAQHVAVLLGCAGVFPVLEAVLLLRHHTTGNPRYFMLVILFGTASVPWLMRDRHGPPRLVAAVLIGLLVIGSVATTVALTDPLATHSETENAVFDRLLRRPAPSPPGEWATWSRVAHRLDPLLGGNRRVLADATYAFPALLESARPSHFILPSDRDWDRTVADPEGKVDVVILPSPEYVQLKKTRYRSVPQQVIDAEPGVFTKIADFGIVSLWSRPTD